MAGYRERRQPGRWTLPSLPDVHRERIGCTAARRLRGGARRGAAHGPVVLHPALGSRRRWGAAELGQSGPIAVRTDVCGDTALRYSRPRLITLQEVYICM